MVEKQNVTAIIALDDLWDSLFGRKLNTNRNLRCMPVLVLNFRMVKN